MRLNPTVRIAATSLIAVLALGMAACTSSSSGSGGASKSGGPSAVANPMLAAKLGACQINVSTNLSIVPTVTIPACPTKPPTLTRALVVAGAGAQVQQGQTVTVQYVGYNWSTGKQISSSWADGKPLSVTLGSDFSVPLGWNFDLIGTQAGGRYVMVFPPDMASPGTGLQPGVGENDTVFFVADVLKVAAS